MSVVTVYITFIHVHCTVAILLVVEYMLYDENNSLKSEFIVNNMSFLIVGLCTGIIKPFVF